MDWNEETMREDEDRTMIMTIINASFAHSLTTISAPVLDESLQAEGERASNSAVAISGEIISTTGW